MEQKINIFLITLRKVFSTHTFFAQAKKPSAEGSNKEHIIKVSGEFQLSKYC